MPSNPTLKVQVSAKLAAIRRAELHAMIEDGRRAMARLPACKPCPKCGQASRLVGGGADQCMACLGVLSDAE